MTDTLPKRSYVVELRGPFPMWSIACKEGFTEEGAASEAKQRALQFPGKTFGVMHLTHSFQAGVTVSGGKLE